jgi:beta-glucosidase
MEMRDRDNTFDIPVPDSLSLADELAAIPSVRRALTDRLGPAVALGYARGSGLLDGTDEEIAQAVTVAREAQVAILVLGERSGLTDDSTVGEARDRMDLGLPGRQGELLTAVLDTGTPVVLVLLSGRPLAIPEAAARCAAILMAWAPGETGSRAIVETLVGDRNPGGKLPVTVPRHVGQVPTFHGHKPSGGRSAWKTDYVDGPARPLWAFGHGRSYTTFALSDLVIDRPTLAVDGEVSIGVTVSNTGDRAGDEVVQLYVRDVEASVTRPVTELLGFARVTLEPRASRRVRFSVLADQLAFTGLDGVRAVEPGVVAVSVGRAADDLPLRGSFELVGERRPVPVPGRFLSLVRVSAQG